MNHNPLNRRGTMAKRREGLSERHKKILEILEYYQDNIGYPPSIREIGKRASITSTSVVNYYLNQLEEDGYIERDRKISRGLKLVKKLAEPVEEIAESVRTRIEEIIRIPVIGRIFAAQPTPLPGSDFSYFDPESGVEVARSLLPEREKHSELFALEVEGDSMIDAMVNDGDIVIMKRSEQAQNGEMVAVWLKDESETTLKYFYRENGNVRLQPANPTMEPIYKDPNTIQIQGKVVLVIRQVKGKAV
jgi:repressor LexA